jgi:hypothetical protein
MGAISLSDNPRGKCDIGCFETKGLYRREPLAKCHFLDVFCGLDATEVVDIEDRGSMCKDLKRKRV